MEAYDENATMKESLLLVQNIYLIDYVDEFLAIFFVGKYSWKVVRSYAIFNNIYRSELVVSFIIHFITQSHSYLINL